MCPTHAVWCDLRVHLDAVAVHGVNGLEPVELEAGDGGEQVALVLIQASWQRLRPVLSHQMVSPRKEVFIGLSELEQTASKNSKLTF